MDVAQSNCKGPRERIWYGSPEGCDLDDMAVDYRNRYLEDTETWLGSLSNYTDFIYGEPNILEVPGVKKYCKNLHQYRMPNKTVEEAHENLKEAALDSENRGSRQDGQHGRAVVASFSHRRDRSTACRELPMHLQGTSR